jgi:ABC-2 type transport system ATP-binding protein
MVDYPDLWHYNYRQYGCGEVGPVSGRVVDIRSARKVFQGRRGSKPVVGVDCLTLEIPQGEILGLLGPNGAGKSTAVRMVSGLVTPTSGRILIEGHDVVRQRAKALSRIGVVLDRARTLYPRMTPWENMEYFAVMRGLRDIARLRPRAREWLEFFGIEDVAHKPINDLSMGTRQKVALAAVLAAEPRVVLLDEPTLGLDVQSSVELRKAIRCMAHEEGCTVIITTHQMDVAQDVCDRVCILSEGKVLALDTVRRLLDVFASRAYTMILAGALTDEIRMALACVGRVQVTDEWMDGDSEGNVGYTVVDVDVPDERGLFKAMEVLSLAGIGVESVTRREPCLEAVFLRLTGEEGGGLDESSCYMG